MQGRREDELWLHKTAPFSLTLNSLAYVVPTWNAPHPYPSLCPSSFSPEATALPPCSPPPGSLGPMALCMSLDFTPCLCHRHCPPHCDPWRGLPVAPAPRRGGGIETPFTRAWKLFEG